MTSLRPGIGKEEIHGGHGFGRDEVFNSIGDFDSQQAQVCQVLAVRLLVCSSDANKLAVDADKVDFWMLAGSCNHEATLATSQIHFERVCGMFEKFAQFQSLGPGVGLDDR